MPSKKRRFSLSSPTATGGFVVALVFGFAVILSQIISGSLKPAAFHEIVQSKQKISDTSGNFLETLEDADRFGSGVAHLGDLDNDGVDDVAVGAYWDDDGGADKGAVYILFMNTNGTVKSSQKISEGTGGFGGTLSAEFGLGMAGLGDLDGDGVEDLADPLEKQQKLKRQPSFLFAWKIKVR